MQEDFDDEESDDDYIPGDDDEDEDDSDEEDDLDDEDESDDETTDDDDDDLLGGGMTNDDMNKFLNKNMFPFSGIKDKWDDFIENKEEGVIYDTGYSEFMQKEGGRGMTETNVAAERAKALDEMKVLQEKLKELGKQSNEYKNLRETINKKWEEHKKNFPQQSQTFQSKYKENLHVLYKNYKKFYDDKKDELPEPAFTKKNVLPKNTYEEALQAFWDVYNKLMRDIRHQIQEFRNDQNTDIDEYTGLPYFSENAAIFVMLNQKEAIRASGDTVDVPPQYKLSDYKFIPIPTQPEVTNVSNHTQATQERKRALPVSSNTGMAVSNVRKRKKPRRIVPTPFIKPDSASRAESAADGAAVNND